MVIPLPSLLPVASGLGTDPIHYAIVIVAAVGIGLVIIILAPPITLILPRLFKLL